MWRAEPFWKPPQAYFCRKKARALRNPPGLPNIRGMNLHVRDFLSGIEARYPDDTSVMAMSTWLERNTKLKKEQFSFRNYEFQRQIADDLHPQLSCMKPSQVGLSELQIRKFLAFLKRNTAVTGIFTLPNDKMRDRISQTRIKPLVDSEAVFNGPTARALRSDIRHN